MKIVMIAGDSGSGGLIGYIRGLLSAEVIPAGFESVLFCGKNLSEKINDISTPVKIISTDLAKEKGIDVFFNKPLPASFIELIEKEKPDVIFFLHGHIRKGLEKHPNIMVLHNQLHIDICQLFKFGFNLLTLKLIAIGIAVRRSMKKADGVVFLSSFSKNQTDEKKIKYNKGKVIPFGFESANRVDEPPEKKTGETVRIIYISALLPYKNHLNLLKACNMLRKESFPFILLLVGQQQGPVYKKLKKYVTEHDMADKVLFHNWIEHSKIKEIIDTSDVFIYASSIETTGYGLLEGMARGSLIACSAKAGFPDILKDGGIYFDPENVISIKKSILSIINADEKTQIQLRTKALEYSKNFTWETAVRLHYDFFKETIKGSAHNA